MAWVEWVGSMLTLTGVVVMVEDEEEEEEEEKSSQRPVCYE